MVRTINFGRRPFLVAFVVREVIRVRGTILVTVKGQFIGFVTV